MSLISSDILRCLEVFYMQLLTAKEVAGILRLPLARVYELTRLNAIPVVRLGLRQLRYDSEALTEWAKSGGCANAGDDRAKTKEN
jgi:excisionase family DNA binding protein